MIKNIFVWRVLLIRKAFWEDEMYFLKLQQHWKIYLTWLASTLVSAGWTVKISKQDEIEKNINHKDKKKLRGQVERDSKTTGNERHPKGSGTKWLWRQLDSGSYGRCQYEERKIENGMHFTLLEHHKKRKLQKRMLCYSVKEVFEINEQICDVFMWSSRTKPCNVRNILRYIGNSCRSR